MSPIPDTYSHFHRQIHAAFLPISFSQKNTNTNYKYRKDVHNTFVIKSCFQMLVKLTPQVSEKIIDGSFKHFCFN